MLSKTDYFTLPPLNFKRGDAVPLERIYYMKIASAQINTKIGDFEGNVAMMVERIKWAKAALADMVVFPEMAITGYPAKDLLDRPSFIAENLKAIEIIAKESTRDFAVIAGFISVNKSSRGKGIYNSAAFMRNGKIELVQNKTLLPTYDIFDEDRYFEPSGEHHIVKFKGRKFGITICEDIWAKVAVEGRKLYDTEPVSILVKKGAEFIINLSASPFMVGKQETREKLLTGIARKYNIPIVYTNMVGGNDEIVFDGASMIVDSKGRISRDGGFFTESRFVTDIDDIVIGRKKRRIEPEEIYMALVTGVRDYVLKCGFKKVVIGLSGGIDSAIVATIAADALGPANVLGIAMPTRFNSEESLSDAKVLAKNLGISFKKIGIDALFQNYLDLVEPYFEGKEFDSTEENIQARIRGNILMAFSNKYGAMVLSTGNKSEMAVGYCTLYGDLTGGLAVISDVPKTTVYKLADYVNQNGERIPQVIIDRPPSAELRPDQKDQDTLPPYDVLDKILKLYIEDRKSKTEIIKKGFSKTVVDDVIRRIDQSEYKRKQAPPGLKITSKAFGAGRRYPVAKS